MEVIHSSNDIELVEGIIQAHNKILLYDESHKSIRNLERYKNRLFDLLVSKHFNHILNSLRFNNSINAFDAETFVIEAFSDLYLKILSGKYKEEGKLKAYVKLSAHRLFLKSLKKPIDISIDKKQEQGNEDNENKIFRESKNSDNYLDELDAEIFETEEEKNLIFECVQEMIKQISNDCQDLIYAQYSKPKISDNEFYENNKDTFSSVDAVRKKRGKCMQKLRSEKNGLEICIEI